MRKTFISLVIFVVGFPLLAYSQENGLSLEDALALALKNNPDILRAQKETDAAKGRFLQLSAVPNPEVALSSEGISFGSRRGESEVSLRIFQTIEFPGKRSLRKTIGNVGETISLARLERTRLIVTAKVKKTYAQAVYSQRVIVHLQSVLSLLEHYQELASIRFQAGEVATADVLRGRLEYLKMQSELAEARLALEKDLVSLFLTLGMEKPETVRLTQNIVFVPLQKDLGAWKKEAETRPTLKALQGELDQAAAGVELARKSFYPDLKVGLYYPSLRMSGWGFEIGSSIPLRTTAQRGEMLEAEAVRQERFISLNAGKREILSRVEKAFFSVKTAAERLQLFEKSLLGEAEEMLRAGIRDYEFGKTDSLSLFDLIRTYKDIQLEHLRSFMNYELSLSELEAAGEEVE